MLSDSITLPRALYAFCPPYIEASSEMSHVPYQFNSKRTTGYNEEAESVQQVRKKWKAEKDGVVPGKESKHGEEKGGARTGTTEDEEETEKDQVTAVANLDDNGSVKQGMDNAMMGLGI
jgi:hypothetical protein